MALFLTVSVSVIILALLTKFYIKLTVAWCRSQTCLVGKTAIITGANAGIGYQVALDFAKRGAKVILACRNKEKSEKARLQIIEETGNDNVIAKHIDMASFESVRAFAKDINKNETRLDILVNNAGIAEMEDKRSVDGQVLILQVNSFSSFLLTNLLLNLLKRTKGSRVVNVASIAAKFVRNFDVNKLHLFPGGYRAYPHSKLCNILFTIELARRLKGTEVTAYSVHPGAIQTNIIDYVRGPLAIFVVLAKRFFFKTTEEGAQTPIYCSVTKGIEKYSGEHFDRCRKVERYNVARNPELAERLWKVSEEIVQLKSEDI